MEEPLSSLASAGADNKHFKDFISGECCGMLSPGEEKGGGQPPSASCPHLRICFLLSHRSWPHLMVFPLPTYG